MNGLGKGKTAHPGCPAWTNTRNAVNDDDDDYDDDDLQFIYYFKN